MQEACFSIALDKDQDVTSSTQTDVRFFRNTGVALITATLLAGGMTLALTVRQGSAIALADTGEEKTEVIQSQVLTPTPNGYGPPLIEIKDLQLSKF